MGYLRGRVNRPSTVAATDRQRVNVPSRSRLAADLNGGGIRTKGPNEQLSASRVAVLPDSTLYLLYVGVRDGVLVRPEHDHLRA
jgi:hypothetical protein